MQNLIKRNNYGKRQPLPVALAAVLVFLISIASAGCSHSDSSHAAPKDLIPVTVAKETDGDTIHVTMPSGKDETIRMLLIDTPETHDARKPVEPFGPAASAFAKKCSRSAVTFTYKRVSKAIPWKVRTAVGLCFPFQNGYV